jgi:hypothetical protein
VSALRDTTAAALNRECRCSVVDVPRLRGRIESVLGDGQSIVHSHPHLFSDLPVFITADHRIRMQRAIEAIESVVGSAAWQRAALDAAPDVARKYAAPHGVFFGYDFHIGADGPRLIEINTNAGGAFLNIAARDAQIACCEAGDDYLQQLPDSASLEDVVVDMFRNEWRLARGGEPLRTIAIVDADPRAQFLYPEFLLAQRIFESRGIAARVVDASALRVAGGRVVVDDEAIDLIYNRSTDFYLEAAGSAALLAAWKADLAVITPHPRAHAAYANKRNLVWLSDGDLLARMGIGAAAIATLRGIVPIAREMRGDDESWWSERKEWFFKPANGFGSRGTYRGDKLTRRVFAELLNGNYIAQQLTPPGERLGMKTDIRCYTYEGRIQLMAARLYQGQTTNFRTAGGGFAPVYVTT